MRSWTGVGVSVGVEVIVGVGITVGVQVGTDVLVKVGTGRVVGVRVAVVVTVRVGKRVGVAFRLGVLVGVEVGTLRMIEGVIVTVGTAVCAEAIARVGVLVRGAEHQGAVKVYPSSIQVRLPPSFQIVAKTSSWRPGWNNVT
jgi:hypothetical protein